MFCDLSGMHFGTVDGALKQFGIRDQTMPGVQHNGSEYFPFPMAKLVAEEIAGDCGILERGSPNHARLDDLLCRLDYLLCSRGSVSGVLPYEERWRYRHGASMDGAVVASPLASLSWTLAVWLTCV